MLRQPETLDEANLAASAEDASGPPRPGLLLIFCAGEPLFRPLPLGEEPLLIGRDSLPDLADPLLSRRHAQVERRGGEYRVRDLGSRNGTALDGEALREERSLARVLRTSGTLFLLCPDLRPLASGVRQVDGAVMGPLLQRAWESTARAAGGPALHIHGESGAGKELVARAFHRCGKGAAGPFIAVNCAAIPESVAERLLFGARRGAYSGAAVDSEGYVQAAHGGTLFLDEVADLDLQVQAKLLRVLETREVLQLGATRPRPVDLQLCSATHKDLREQVAAGHLREDLYFRIGRPQVDVPPLRARLEEVPWLIASALREAAPGLRAHVSLVEACLLRPWPGNVRELLGEVRTAAQAARAQGAAEVKAQHLAPEAGLAFASPAPPGAEPEEEERRALEQALRHARGNVSRAARDLGLHRTQLRRLLARHGLSPRPRAGPVKGA